MEQTFVKNDDGTVSIVVIEEKVVESFTKEQIEAELVRVQSAIDGMDAYVKDQLAQLNSRLDYLIKVKETF